MYPSYLDAQSNGRLRKIADDALRMLESCAICPRKCRVNRLKGELGFCKTARLARVCSFMPHYGEEPPISGTRGSGTIFFSGCNLRCAYCQNYAFSQSGEGGEVEPAELAGFMLNLQNQGCHNINLVTPTHVMPQILKALSIAACDGLRLPLVYNTSGYELPEIIKLLEGLVDIYLADMRYAESEMARKYSQAADYPAYNQAAVKEMQRQVGVANFSRGGIIKSGLVIRHLVLPNNISGAKRIIKFIAGEISPDTYISLMSQYAPYYQATQIRELSRRINLQEYREAEKAMKKYGLYNGWTQEDGGLERFAGVHIKPSLKKK